MSINPNSRISLKDFLDKEIEVAESWWGDRLFGPGYRLIIGGRSGSKKSFFTLGMILKMGLNTEDEEEYIGFPITSGKKILYMNFEINESGMQERLRHMSAHIERDMLNNIDIINSYDFRIDKKEDAIEFYKLIMEGGYDIVALDCMYKMHNSKENNEDEMKPILMMLDALIAKGVSVILVHHHSKGNSSRGSSVIEDWADTIVSMNPDKNKVVFDKVRNSESPNDISVVFNDSLFFEVRDNGGPISKVTEDVIINILDTEKVQEMSRSEVGQKLEKLEIAKIASLRKWKPQNEKLEEIKKGNRTFYRKIEV